MDEVDSNDLRAHLLTDWITECIDHYAYVLYLYGPPTQCRASYVVCLFVLRIIRYSRENLPCCNANRQPAFWRGIVLQELLCCVSGCRTQDSRCSLPTKQATAALRSLLQRRTNRDLSCTSSRVSCHRARVNGLTDISLAHCT